MKIQTSKIVNNILTPSKIWNIPKEKLIKIKYFENIFEFSNIDNNLLELSYIQDNYFTLVNKYIEFADDNKKLNKYIKELDNNNLLILLKISDYLLIDDLLNLLKSEFYLRLIHNKFT
tara:strand:+ start:105 stop:458 length:354 start_codon:yes stop_codon:yes gene_type:complete